MSEKESRRYSRSGSSALAVAVADMWEKSDSGVKLSSSVFSVVTSRICIRAICGSCNISLFKVEPLMSLPPVLTTPRSTCLVPNKENSILKLRKSQRMGPRVQSH
ncbi:unnamed protein product [Brassica rapa subsp. narinosa]